jgi:hypothetical protein
LKKEFSTMAHHHHKNEMEHHKMREHHKKSHRSEKAEEYSHHPHMIDNRMVSENHQQGIERVKMRKGDLEVGQHGSMAGGWKNGHHSEGMTPKKG